MLYLINIKVWIILMSNVWFCSNVESESVSRLSAFSSVSCVLDSLEAQGRIITWKFRQVFFVEEDKELRTNLDVIQIGLILPDRTEAVINLWAKEDKLITSQLFFKMPKIVVKFNFEQIRSILISLLPNGPGTKTIRIIELLMRCNTKPEYVETYFYKGTAYVIKAGQEYLNGNSHPFIGVNYD